MTRVVSVAAAALAAALAQPAFAVELPPRARGLWEMTLTREGEKKVQRNCVKPNERPGALRSMGEKGECRRTMTRSGAGYVSDTECRVYGMVFTGRTVFEGDFRTRVRARGRVVMTGTDRVPTGIQSAFTLDGRRVGDCRR